ncbi:capsular polysaccharide synthesis protein [Clostridium botulinum]|uniref:capsular polysaccharide synthesis protein n=1 Tax=Clostridium botulinum TaxID=1491 RepID=UPI001C9ACB7F|nr:capsular polysaccharide synthesis protein [Clostridium botulinum]MBY6811416.1 capsular polysaccharide synthesis protein [Clostridium botulinum]MBY6824833.1 capsular polysaccharide synthesis protein [Clostridium botulinum]MBY6835229.1 capsular polysaccharide synthesis protein [Clostridium botulinum]MBY6973742.1 capsular polysaccharide synthesis protein [Clostridium botulinum]HBJ1651643.1 capsular polysaccharide synthesis protein [Clostridium botulinum]
MKKFRNIFNKVNGREVLKQYKRAGVLGFALIETLMLGFSHKSLEIVRLAVNNRILSKLRKEYGEFINEYKKRNTEKIFNLPRKKSNKVWVCWLQGMDYAPFIVKRCYDSLKLYLKDRNIVLITENNYRDYITFPSYIQDKIDNKVITKTHFSDLLRLELLIKYGGSWLDATILCTSDNIPNYILNSNLFVFQCLKPGKDGHCTSISSWLMTACTNNPILLLTRELLYDYWKKYNFMKDYFLIHNFFQLAIETYPEEWKKVIPFSNSVPHILLLNLFEKYDEQWLNCIKNMTPFHKLSYKFSEDKLEKKDTFYTELIVKNSD